MMLFASTSSQERRLKQHKKGYTSSRNGRKIQRGSTASHSMFVIVAAYTVDNDDEMAPDVNEEGSRDMLAGRSR